MNNHLLSFNNPVLNPTAGGDVKNATSGLEVISKFISAFVSLAFVFGGLILVFMLLWGGLEYLTAGGDKAATESASKRIQNALIGIALLASTFAIIYILNNILGIDLTSLNLPLVTP